MSEKLSNLTEAESTGSGDKYYVVQGGESKQIDFDDLPFGGGSLNYQTPIINNTTLDGTQKGLNNLYPVVSDNDIQITIASGDYVENDVINIERVGNGNVEIVADNDVFIRGVRDIDNRYFINDNHSLISLLCKGGEEFTIIGNLTRGYTGAVTTSSYSTLSVGDINEPITVIGTGFSANMKTPIVSSNATLVSWSYINNNQITLFLTAVGGSGDDVTITYDNGDVFVDTDAITIGTDIPTANLLRYYRFDNNLTDQVGLGNGVGSNVSYVTGKSGQAADFNGSNSKCTVSDAPDLSFGNGSIDNPFSISLYVKFDVIPTGNAFIIEKMDNSTNLREWQLLYAGSLSSLRLQLNKTGVGGNNLVADDNSTYNTGVWYHIVATYDGSGSSSGLKIYKDSIIQITNNVENGTYTAMSDTSADVTIGSRIGTGSVLDGAIDGLGVWNIELSQQNITDIFNKQDSGLELL